MSTIKDNFYLRLREERIRLGLSQAVISDKCDVSRVIWGKYESGASMPGAEVMIYLAEIGADVDYLLKGERYSSANKTLQVMNFDKEDQLHYLITAFNNASIEGRQALLALANCINSIYNNKQ